MAISVDPPEEATKLREKLELGFPVLADPEQVAIRAFGLHDARKDIALPATYVIAPDGEIAWRYVGDLPADRPPEEHILDALAGSPDDAQP